MIPFFSSEDNKFHVLVGIRNMLKLNSTLHNKTKKQHLQFLLSTQSKKRNCITDATSNELRTVHFIYVHVPEVI